ncbi:CidA/LrgA family protein [Castellaniella sp.]|uniref:CidA/LrgA family protein n=1 Tax=Castellaniella sp. TaxID=1955812 RepID=UPI002AFE1878|nr:CidA/LrgA family protein [Castellaniella sp.]
MVGAIAALLLMQLAGTLLVQFTHIPLPGPVVGMLLLFIYLWWRGRVPKPLLRTTQSILENLSLLFVPAGVGVIAHWHEMADQAGRVAIVLVLGVAITLVVTAFTLHWLLGRTRLSGQQE